MSRGSASRRFESDDLSILHLTNDAFFRNTELQPRAQAIVTLLKRTNRNVVDEPLEYGYFRRSLDIIQNRGSFLLLLALAPSFAGMAGLRKRVLKWRLKIDSDLFDLILEFHDWYQSVPPADLLARVVASGPGKKYLRINTHDGIAWFNRERFGDLVFRMYSCAVVDLYSRIPHDQACRLEKSLLTEVGTWKDAEFASGYRVDALLASVDKQR
jgi:hypothetical protein